jgi:prepilin-type N-terminal cleavage/methylation domain-containing protein
MRPWNTKRRRAFTLIETLTAIGILGLLTALMLSAVQSSRSAASRIRCMNNLRQLMMGVSSYNSTFTVFPSACGVPNYEGVEYRSPSVAMKQYSLYTQVLPFIEQLPLYNQINFCVGLQDMYIFGSDTASDPGATANSTAWAAKLSMLSCPADSAGASSGPTGGVNYRVNIGTERWPTLLDGPTTGPFMSYKCVAPSQITDGLSNTVAFSEKPRGSLDRHWLNPLTDMVVGGLGAPYSLDESVASCQQQAGTPHGYYTSGGLSWMVGTLSHTCYNHAIGPNSRTADCILAASNPIVGLLGARSNHADGVNAAVCDGSVKYVTDGIAIAVWRAIATKSGNETETLAP